MTSPRWSYYCTASLLIAYLCVPLSHGADPASSTWAYKHQARPAVPNVQQKPWVHNPVDAFVLSRLEQAGLKPTPAAQKIVLLRRVTYDLTGLLPTTAECADFLHDNRPDAYERVVDRLLASNRFGERWAQHWLDVVRYAETEGYKMDRLRPEAFRYRDYVIRAFNSDMPYSRFLSQQIAGDETEPTNPDAIVATGFWRLHMEESNGDNYRRIRQDILDDNTDTFASAVLGLTFSCARCHDHKFDPISQRDYYRLQAFVSPMIQRDTIPLGTAQELADYAAKQAAWELATRKLRDEIELLTAEHARAIFEELLPALDADTQKALRTPLTERTPLQSQVAALAEKQVLIRQSRAYRRLTPDKRAHYDNLNRQLAEFDTMKPAKLPMAMSVGDVGTDVPATHLLGGGNFLRPRDEVQAGFPSAMGDFNVAVVATPSSTGRRTALARWLFQPGHPLTGRVIANRLWQEYFGEGIVGTPNDFGNMGEKATHPALLDYLASELADSGWKLKSLHRLIVTSNTYRQSSLTDANPTEDRAERIDPDNDLIWHSQLRRRDAESLHDITLQVSGRLNERMFGLSSLPELPAPVNESRSAWYPDAREEDRYRRAIYITARRNLALPLLAAFDAPDRSASCPTRSTTISAPQSLVMLNSKFTLDQARRLAEQLTQSCGSDLSALVRDAYQATYSREPAPQELAAALRFLARQAQVARSSPVMIKGAEGRPPASPAVIDFCHALMNAVEFMYVE